MTQSKLLSEDSLLGLCDVWERRRRWSDPPQARTVAECRREAEDLLDGFPTPIEEIAAILFAFSRNEYRLKDAAIELPVAASIAQARQSGIRVTDPQIDLLKDLQDEIAGDLSWVETVARCEQIMRPTRK
jgi:hypothetical protein